MPKQYPKERVEELAKILDIEPDEVIEMLNDDERIEKGEKLFDLDPELEKGAKKARQVARGVSKAPTKRERKEDDDKRILIQVLVNALTNGEITDYSVTNPERQIDFVFNDRKFRIVLSAPRS